MIPMFEEASAQFFLMSHDKYNMLVGSLQRIKDGDPLAALRRQYPNIHDWNNKFSIIEDGVGGHMLVRRPKVIGDNDTVDIAELKRVTYLERVFADILAAHGDDHRKGRTLYSSLGDVVHNVPQDVYKIFTDLCAHCIQHHHRTCPTAGLHPIVTNGFNVHGQVNLIDFQIMPDGDFRFLMNYIDHGVKYLFSIPIVWKRASCIAMALLQIFTVIGPPLILQSDNGSEFHGAALSAA